jgi:hydrogenase expression/formation protein HypC
MPFGCRNRPHIWEPHYKHIALKLDSQGGRSILCLTIPGRVVRINGDLASVDYGGDGVRDNINISLVNASLGDYVLVQSGFAVKLLSESEASESLELWKAIRELDAEPT